MKTVNVRYFAVFRELSGVSAESVESSSPNLVGLYRELSDRYRFQLDPSEVKASLNLGWVSLDQPFEDGDEIVFIPPVAGG